MINRIPILSAITDVIKRSSIYSESKGTVEFERLYFIAEGLENFVSITQNGFAQPDPEIIQEDFFFDIRRGDKWQLADTDYFVRLRIVRNRQGEFEKGEIKVGYPGPLSNPNARFSPAEKLTEDAIKAWENHLKFLGFELERRYKKKRIPFKISKRYQGFEMELEADKFTEDSFNGTLAGKSFVSISIEAEGSENVKAEEALMQAYKELNKLGVSIKECVGNYEYYYYGREVLPLHEKAIGVELREISQNEFDDFVQKYPWLSQLIEKCSDGPLFKIDEDVIDEDLLATKTSESSYDSGYNYYSAFYAVESTKLFNLRDVKSDTKTKLTIKEALSRLGIIPDFIVRAYYVECDEWKDFELRIYKNKSK
ncbi:hypothetical protein FJZ31_00125 [Candidatus Poribacteria bacterium]|nr:hypothetical protein [Candidatus Poribacteria bacterium]